MFAYVWILGTGSDKQLFERRPDDESSWRSRHCACEPRAGRRAAATAGPASTPRILRVYHERDRKRPQSLNPSQQESRRTIADPESFSIYLHTLEERSTSHVTASYNLRNTTNVLGFFADADGARNLQRLGRELCAHTPAQFLKKGF